MKRKGNFIGGLVVVGVVLAASYVGRKAWPKRKELVLEPLPEVNPGIANLPLQMTMKVTGYEQGKLTVTIKNESGYPQTYGYDYALSRKEGDEWKKLSPNEEICWIQMAVELEDLQSKEETYDLSYFEPLAPGLYRLEKMDGLQAEFRLGWSK